MNLSELMREVWKDKRLKERQFLKEEVELVIKVFIEYAVKSLLKHKVLKLRGLFTLDIRRIKGRRMKHPKTKEEMYSKDYYRVGLKPSKELKEGLDKMRNED